MKAIQRQYEIPFETQESEETVDKLESGIIDHMVKYAKANPEKVEVDIFSSKETKGGWPFSKEKQYKTTVLKITFKEELK